MVHPGRGNSLMYMHQSSGKYSSNIEVHDDTVETGCIGGFIICSFFFLLKHSGKYCKAESQRNLWSRYPESRKC